MTRVAADPGPIASLWQSLGFSKSQEPFLEPEKAFVFTAEVIDVSTVAARWQIAKGYYLYRNKFSFRVEHAQGITLGEPVFPAGGKVKKDEFFGVMEVYYDHVDITLPLAQREASVRRMVLEASYQGCAEAGFCYAPMTRTVEIDLPSGEGVAPISAH